MSKKKEDIPKSERSEIVNNILGAKNRKEQLKIEADLHLTSVTTIKEILKDYGVNLKIFNGGSHKKKRIEDELAEEQEIITPVEEIGTVEEQAEPDEIGQAWADLSIPPDVELPPLTAEPLPPLSNEERVCKPIPAEQAEKIPYTKPEIIEPSLPKYNASAEDIIGKVKCKSSKDRNEFYVTTATGKEFLRKRFDEAVKCIKSSTSAETAADSIDIDLSYQRFKKLIREKMHCEDRLEEINAELKLYRDTCNCILLDLKEGGIEA